MDSVMFNVGQEVKTKIDLIILDTEESKLTEPEDYFIPKGSKGVITEKIITEETFYIVCVDAWDKKCVIQVNNQTLEYFDNSNV